MQLDDEALGAAAEMKRKQLEVSLSFSSKLESAERSIIIDVASDPTGSLNGRIGSPLQPVQTPATASRPARQT